MSRKRSRLYKEKGKGHWHGDLSGDLPLESQYTVYDIHAERDQLETCASGQRWCSTMEPELGLGTITSVEKRRITISFQDGACIRQYSTEGAPIKRIRFQPGDNVSTRDGVSDTIASVEENNGVIIYLCPERVIPETELSDRIALTTPLDRLLAGHTDSNEDFLLRYSALYWRSRINCSPVRGYIGGRIQLLPHQLYIAGEVSSLHRKRVLLADEVGLGKTIEACLILHRLLICEHVTRVLIIVPESMVHVWFVELLRKFNLTFRIYDEEYHSSLLSTSDGGNAFYHDQLVLGNGSFFADTEEVAQNVTEAQWDLLILDEAHRLVPGSEQFNLVEKISEKCNDILFLTATPQQHGEQNHFARLHLLDPFRYPDYNAFLEETRQHSVIAAITGRILDHECITDEDKKSLLTCFPDCEDILASVSLSDTVSSGARKQLIAGLIDRYGIGRAMFRNTRVTAGGFPARKVEIIPLDGPKAMRDQAINEFNSNRSNTEQGTWHYTKDPRLEFVFALVHSRKKEKFLLICHTRKQVKYIVQALKRRTTMNIAEFHEELSLIQRDRNAAWFSEEEGARLLVCSEIGSEGRNFQFAHRLIMWDVPANPELIEQRIGRLDRIGQTKTITVHIPCIRRTPYEPLITVFNEGLDIFSATVSGATQMFERITDNLSPLYTCDSQTDKEYEQKLSSCVARAKKQKAIIARELEAGHDRLMEQHSFRPKEAAEIVTAIEIIENDETFKKFICKLYKTYGMIVEENSAHISKLWSATATDEEFPGLSPARPFITFDRVTAIAREDLEFITPDHPSVRNGIDMLLSSEKGNAVCGILQSSKERGLLLETLFVVECIAPPQLMVDRFLPPTPVRIIVNHSCEDQSYLLDESDFEESISPCGPLSILEKQEIKQKLIPDMHHEALAIADEKCSDLVKQAIEAMHKTIGNEVKRLTALHKVNPSITREEIEETVTEMVALEEVINKSKPRLDGVRFILQGSGE